MAAHLSLDERRIIATMLHRKTSVAKIALHLGRHRSTIHRETRRNFWHDPEVPMAIAGSRIAARPARCWCSSTTLPGR